VEFNLEAGTGPENALRIFLPEQANGKAMAQLDANRHPIHARNVRLTRMAVPRPTSSDIATTLQNKGIFKFIAMGCSPHCLKNETELITSV
jgi:hypothetical protein